MINVLALNEEKIDFLLTNHKYFKPIEITLAAKIKVMNDKKPKTPGSYSSYQRQLDNLYDGLQQQAERNPYLTGYRQRSVFGGLF